MANSFKVLGSPIEHSKSPVIHRAAYEYLGLDWAYGRSEVPAGELHDYLVSDYSDGYSVTMPLKEEASSLADWRHELVDLAHAANTLVRTKDGLAAYNTDVFGLEQAIGDFDFGAYNVLGTGASARNALIAIAQNCTGARVKVTGRRPDAVESLIEFGSTLGLLMQARESISANPGELTISTVPGHTDATQLVSDASGELFDVAYSPWPSPIGEVWLANGGSLISGIQMLVWQAIGQIRIFSSGNVAQQLPNEFALSQHMLAAAEM